MNQLKFKSVIGMALIKIAYIIMFGYYPYDLTIRISAGADDTGELVIRNKDNISVEPIDRRNMI